MDDPARRGDLAQIHTAKRDLGLDDEVYRAVIRRVTRGQYDSAAALTGLQRRLLIQEFKRLGWQPRRKHGRKPAVARRNQPLLAKIEALLAEANRPWEYADGIVKRMFNIDSLQFCNDEQIHKVTQALLVDQRRRRESK